MATETQSQNNSRQLMAEVNALQNRMKADTNAKKAELDLLIQEINQLQINAIKERDTSKAKIVKAKTRQLFEAQVAHLNARQQTTKQQLVRLNKARGIATDNKQQQQIESFISRKKREHLDLEKELEQIYLKAKQKAISLGVSEEKEPSNLDVPSMTRAKAEAQHLLKEVKNNPLIEHINETTGKAEEAKRLIGQIRSLQEAADKGILTEDELEQLENRVAHIELKQRANRDEINQLTQAKIKYELALAKARKERIALQERKQYDEKLKEELSVLIEEKESEQRQLLDELEAMRMQAEQEANALKAQRDAARALAEKQAEDSDIIGVTHSYHHFIFGGSVVGVVLLVLAIYFLTPVPQLVRNRIHEIMTPSSPTPTTSTTSTPEPSTDTKSEDAEADAQAREDVLDPAQARPLRIFQDRLKDGGVAPSMALLSGGSFIMGNNNIPTESPATLVTLKSFAISQYEITFAEYGRFVRATSAVMPKDQYWGEGDRPVINVTWNAAKSYADWLSAQTGRLYRLPSEREWEFAARAGTNTPYWWGDKFEPNRANCRGCDSQWDNRMTAPVGSFLPNMFNLYDMAGNVMEWTVSCYHQDYTEAPNQMQIWEGGDCSKRVVRGSAYDTPVAHLRLTMRLKQSPSTHAPNLGFRVVRVN